MFFVSFRTTEAIPSSHLDFTNTTELANSDALLQIRISDEAQPLKTASVWGPIGAEAVLAQCYPEEISLFYQTFDVIAARNEGLEYANTLQNHGITVLMARDVLADTLKPKPVGKQEIISGMIKKAKAAQDTFGTNVENLPDLVRTLIELDIDRYGEQKALTLNYTLSSRARLPLGNSLYGRDQMNVLFGQRVVSRMAKPIRRGEVGLYELIYKDTLIPHAIINIPQNETFEGGDAYIHQNYVWVGVGTRTTLGAAIKIYEELQPELDEYGLRFAIVQDENPYNRPFSSQQDFMHLDTFSNPTGKKDIAVCTQEAIRRKVKLIQSIDGKIRVEDSGLSFIDYLEHIVKENEIMEISAEEQSNFGCNFLLIGEENGGNTTILVPMESNTDINNSLTRRGKTVEYVNLYQSTRGYGAAHCMTGQLLRSPYYG